MPTRPSEEELEARLAAERVGAPFLVYRDGEGMQRIFPLEPGRLSATIGRRDEADVSLPWDPECSRLHAELELRAGEWTITDDGLSQNGTWVNELRLYGRRRLANGDLVRVGVERGRKTRKNLKLGICGEHGGDAASVHFFHNVGLDYVSASPYRVPVARLAAAQAALAVEVGD